MDNAFALAMMASRWRIVVNSALAEVKMGLEGGLTYADMRAEETAQILANASGSTVTYKYDEATWSGRIFADYEFTPQVHGEIGYFLTGSLDATYKISGSSATEGYDAMGIDMAAVIYQDDVFFQAYENDVYICDTSDSSNKDHLMTFFLIAI